MNKDKFRSFFLLLNLWIIVCFIIFPKQAYAAGLMESWFIKNGLVIYRDTQSAYLPFLKILMYFYHNLIGFRQISTIALFPFVSLLTLLLVYKLSKQLLTGYYRFIPLLFFALWEPYLSGNMFATSTFLELTIALSFFFWVKYRLKAKPKYIFLSGLFASSAFFSLQIVLPFLLVCGLVFVSTNISVKKNLQNLVYYGIGATIPTAIVFGWFTAKHAIADLIYWNFIYYFHNYPYNIGKEFNNVILFAAIHFPVLMLAFASLNSKNKKDKLSFARLLLLASPFPLTYWFAVLHPMRFSISLPLMALTAGYSLQNMKKSARLWIMIGFMFINIFAFYKTALPDYYKKIVHPKPLYIVSNLYDGDPMKSATEWVNQNTNPSDKLFVIGDPLFYYYAKRVPANHRATATEPIVFFPLSEMNKEIVSNPPDYWIVDTRMLVRFDRDWGFPEVKQNLEQMLKCTKLVANFEYWEIYHSSIQDTSCYVKNK